MARIVLQEWMSLDGVVQAPASPDEDPSGGFAHGGWHMPYFEPTAQEWVVRNVTTATAYLFGRRTYEAFARYWPAAPPGEGVIGEPLNSKPKYVASTTLRGPLSWNNARLLGSDVPREVARLKQELEGDVLVFGSTVLARTLFEHDLVDELRLMIDPVALGGGKRLFPHDGTLREFALASSEAVSTGALLATYRLARAK